MILYFLRHASAGEHFASPKKDEKRALDKEGIEQCGYIGRALTALATQVDVIVSSPLKRCTQTAKRVVKPFGLDIVKVEGLKDLNIGDLSGAKKTDQTHAIVHDCIAHPEKPFPGGESLDAFEIRTDAALHDIFREREEIGSGVTLIAGHGHTMHAAELWISRNETPFDAGPNFDLAATLRFVYRDGRWSAF